MKHIFIILSFLLFFGFSQNPENFLIKEKAESLMQAQIDNKWDVVYTFYDSDYQKTISKDDFMRLSRKMQVKTFKVEKIEIANSGNKAEVQIKKDIFIQGHILKGIIEKQNWIKQGKQWVQKVTASKLIPKKQ